ncbi:F-box/LRR protein [Medicago truncatula]|uniref:F-box/LRR protein n=1 Tax=Medicago truncatula TaxID=3880 RepID=G7J423_MEDTR|nr:F-box/LRR protein [Medicago truncatula]
MFHPNLIADLNLNHSLHNEEEENLSSEICTTNGFRFNINHDDDEENSCWESIFKFIINNDDDEENNRRNLNSLSIVSKQFLSITHRFRFSLNVYHPKELRSLKRYTNLNSLNLARYYNYHTDIDQFLRKISRFPLKLTSLNLSKQLTFPTNGLRVFSQKITTLTSLTCSHIDAYRSLNSSHLLLIAECFPLLEELDLSYPTYCNKNSSSFRDGIQALSLALFKLRKVNFSGCPINNQSLFHLLCNCKLLQDVIMFDCDQITNAGVTSALRERPTLTSLSFSTTPNNSVFNNIHFIDSLVSLKGLTSLDLKRLKISDELLYSIAREGLLLKRLVLQICTGYSYAGIICLVSNCQRLKHLDLQDAGFLNDIHVVNLSLFLSNLVSINLSGCPKLTKSALLTLARYCPSLGEIKMENIGTDCVENSDSLVDFGVYPQLKSLYLGENTWLSDESIIMFASIFPNLQLLDFNSCNRISKGVCEVLRRCSKIRHLNLSECSRVKLLGMNFAVPKLEVLDLSFTKVDDKTLYAISKNCCGLLQLLLEHCDNVKEKGVKHVVENCTQLREQDRLLY